MVDRLVKIGVWVGFAVTIAIMLINALYMLVSPKAWFGLPGWLGLQGVMTRKSYGDRSGGLQVRALGAIIIGTFAWIVIGLTTGK